MAVKFDISTIDTLEADFLKAKLESYEKDDGWTWLNCDLPLYVSCKNRLLKQMEAKDAEINKNKSKKKWER